MMATGGHLLTNLKTMTQACTAGDMAPALSKSSVKTASVNGDKVLEEGDKKDFSGFKETKASEIPTI